MSLARGPLKASPARAQECLIRWWLILRKHGVVIISVPDMEETFNLIENGDIKFGLRHLRGSRRNLYNWHSAWYTRNSLVELCESIGFAVEPLLNFHDYPALVVRLHKQ